jgi:hypothetical protein
LTSRVRIVISVSDMKRGTLFLLVLLLAIFQKNCADCHAPGEEEPPSLDKATNLLQLRNNSDYVIAGAPEKSLLFQRVDLPVDSRKRMPKSSTKNPREALTTEEKTTIRQWIAGDSTAAERPFLSETDVLNLLLADQRTLPKADRGGYRYLTLHNLHNLPARIESDEYLTIYRAGVAKLLNSLSWERMLVVPETIDPAGAVLRFKLSDYGWTEAMWTFVAERNPYGH